MKQAADTLTIREKKFVKAKLAGKNNTQAAQIATGTTNKKVARVQGSRMITSVSIQETIKKELEKLKVTPAKILKVFAEAMEASTTIVHGKDSNESWVEVVPDHRTRMVAAQKFADIMGIRPINDDPGKWKAVTPSDIPTLPNNPEVNAALKGSDEVELQRVIFKRDT